MSVLRNKIGVEEKRFLGAYVPESLFTYLNIYCLANDKSRNSQLVYMLKRFFHKSPSMESLCTQISCKIQNNWEIEKRIKNIKPIEERFNEFRNKAQDELLKKGMNQNQVLLIIKSLKP